jgi:hypothetical protein
LLARRLGQQLKALAPGLTPRSVLEKFAAVQMIDVYVPPRAPIAANADIGLPALYRART